MTVEFQIFRGRLTSWTELFQEASEYASELGEDRVINISHSSDQGDGVVVVWFWA